jgi:hypothetical protein
VVAHINSLIATDMHGWIKTTQRRLFKALTILYDDTDMNVDKTASEKRVDKIKEWRIKVEHGLSQLFEIRARMAKSSVLYDFTFPEAGEPLDPSKMSTWNLESLDGDETVYLCMLPGVVAYSNYGVRRNEVTMVSKAVVLV